MISVSKDDDGRVIGYIEWRQVGQSGFDKFRGEYVWIHNFWIHPDYRGKSIFSELVEKVLISSSGATQAYFRRSKYSGRVSKLYSREQFTNFVRKEETKWAAIQT